MKRGPGSPRCTRCRQIVVECICATMQPVVTPTHVSLILHRDEWRKPTSTGVLAHTLLSNSRLSLYHGADTALLAEQLWQRDTTPVVLFPSAHAEPLERFIDRRPVTLIVPDGTWNQAKRIPRRLPALKGLAWAGLDIERPLVRNLRTASAPHRVSTLEAIARALGVLDGPEVAARLLDTLRDHVNATLRARGTLGHD